MQIGKAGAAESHICQAYPDRVEVRGLDLCRDLMGRMSFTEYFHLLSDRAQGQPKRSRNSSISCSLPSPSMA